MKERTTIQRSQAFTLIELLTVMVVMGIIMTIALPSFTKLGTGSGVNSGVRMLSAQVRLARQYAITRRKKVAVMMPGPNAAKLPNTHRYSCYRPAIVTGTGNSYTFESWVDNTKWLFLPQGVSIMEADDDTGIYTSGSNALKPVDDTYAAVAIQYKDVVPIGGSSTDTDIFNCRCLVFTSSGRVKGSTDWITVGDATFIGPATTDWVIRDPVKAGDPLDSQTISCQNQQSIVLDTFTGRAIVKSPVDY